MSAALLAQGAVFPVTFSHHSFLSSCSSDAPGGGGSENSQYKNVPPESNGPLALLGAFFLFKLPVVFTSVCVLDTRGKNRLYRND